MVSSNLVNTVFNILNSETWLRDNTPARVPRCVQLVKLFIMRSALRAA